MNSTPSPGLRNQSTGRTVLRVVGAVLFLGGLYLAITGGKAAFETTGDFQDPAGSDIAKLVVGMFTTIFGLGMLNAGFLGAQSRYVAGETMPVVKDSAAYLSDGRGIMDIGRTTSDQPVSAGAATGPYCRSCGVRNDADARFCDGCGTSLS